MKIDKIEWFFIFKMAITINFKSLINLINFNCRSNKIYQSRWVQGFNTSLYVHSKAETKILNYSNMYLFQNGGLLNFSCKSADPFHFQTITQTNGFFKILNFCLGFTWIGLTLTSVDFERFGLTWLGITIVLIPRRWLIYIYNNNITVLL